MKPKKPRGKPYKEDTDQVWHTMKVILLKEFKAGAFHTALNANYILKTVINTKLHINDLKFNNTQQEITVKVKAHNNIFLVIVLKLRIHHKLLFIYDERCAVSHLNTSYQE